MSILPTIYKATGSVTIVGTTVTPNDVLVMTGAVNGSLIKSLELVNTDAYDAVVHIKRRDGSDVVYQDIKVDILPFKTVMLWDDFNVLNSGHDLILTSDSNDIDIVVTCFEGF